MLIHLRCYTGEIQSRIAKSGNPYKVQEVNQAIVDTETGEILALGRSKAFTDGNPIGFCERRRIVCKFDARGDVLPDAFDYEQLTPSEANKLCPPLIPELLKENSKARVAAAG